jgi:hypothetical protein
VLPALTLITFHPGFLGLTFHCYATPADLPPEYLFADWSPTASAREDHAQALARLATLGRGEPADTSNCLARTWRFGVFRVELHTFPPELQSPMCNTLLELAPHLAVPSTVSLHSEYAWALPDPALVGLTGPEVVGRPCWSRAGTRRNGERPDVSGAIAWRRATGSACRRRGTP